MFLLLPYGTDSFKKARTSAIAGTQRQIPHERPKVAPGCFARMRPKLNRVKYKSRLKQESMSIYLAD
jgi:hypothetical protein